MRLFVAVWPSPEVAGVLESIARPEDPSVRWTTPDQWHVTLRFLGEMAEDDVPSLVRALDAVRSQPPRRATMGPATARLGRHVLMVPVAGLDDLGQAVSDASRAFGSAPDDRPFTGHLTLARGRGGHAVPAALAGQPAAGSWPVTEVALVRSHLGPAGACYETLAVIALDGAIPFAPAAEPRPASR